MTEVKEKPKRSSTIKTSTLPDGHVVLVSKETEWAYTLSPLAAIVWEFCDGTNSLDDIVSNVQAIPEFAVNNFKKEEIAELLEQLDEGGYFEE